MTKADLVEQVAEAIGPGVTKRDCALVVDGFLNAVKHALANGRSIEIRGFGTFKVRDRRARMARNPRTGEPVMVPARSTPVFKPSKFLRAQVAEGGAATPRPGSGGAPH
ncbi:MAG: integration host factor subunit beta [Acidobacteria bacterium]|nr:integration host factor subunit beta [Gemmatimonadota bacterium]MYF15625.1 integration host factor subunit beta [Acidobacteriota bacterium]MDE2677330.1 integration host factor subunit beta [Gemmatimonadota bacterium]MXX34044.1 integration host factor subunit beta [Gemmatimonadota bacterium]MYA10117.1 integration host factor subunit beta [Gemmatimonadota bacterium]